MDRTRKYATHLVLSEETPVNGDPNGYTGRSPIENLPDKVLARIFHAGVLGDEDHDDEDDGPEGNASTHDISRGDDDNEDGHYHDGHDHHFHFFPFPVLVSHVCTRWRALALETPALWATLSFTRVTSLDRIRAHIARSGTSPLSIFIDAYVPEFSIGSNTANSAVFRLLSGTMENGLRDTATVGGLPGYELEDGLPNEDHEGDDQLEVTSLRDFGNSNAANGTRQERLFLTSKDLFEIFELITPSVERWKEFHFDTNTYLYIPFILSQLSRLPESPLLECLALFSSQTMGQHENDLFKISSSTNVATASSPKAPGTSLRRSSSISSTSSTPLPFGGKFANLKKLALWGIPVDQWDPSNRLRFGPLNKLDNLSLSFQSLDALLDIISLATNVGTLTLNYEPYRGDQVPILPSSPIPASPIALPELDNLTLNRFGSDIAADFIRSVRVPALRILRFDADPDKDGNHGYSLLTTSNPQGSSSISLSVPSHNPDPSSTTDPSDYASFISALLSADSGVNLTRLETLEVHGLYCSDDVAFDSFVRKLTGLKTLMIEWDDHARGAEQIVRKLGQERQPEGDVFIPSLDNLSLANVETSEQLRVVREALDSRHVLSGFKGFKSLTFP